MPPCSGLFVRFPTWRRFYRQIYRSISFTKMKLLPALVTAIIAKQQYDPSQAIYDHHQGCLFPTSQEISAELISNDKYAQFSLSNGAQNEDYSYTEGSELHRECAVFCSFDGQSDTCTYGSSDTSFTCIKKKGKGSRAGHDFFMFVETSQLSKKIPKAALFRSSTYQLLRTAGNKLLCPKPSTDVADSEGVCGDRPQIPQKQDRFNRYTKYTDDLSSVECLPNGIYKVKNPRYLNLVCTQLKPGKGEYKWLSEETRPNGRIVLVNPASRNNMLKDKYLCKLNKDYVEESGDGEDEEEGSAEEEEEGSGAGDISVVDVSM